MLQEIDKTLWFNTIKRTVKLSTNFKWHFYGRRFTNFCVSCSPDRRDYWRNKVPKYKVEYSDSVEIEANSEQEAIHKAWQQMFCDGPNDYCFCVTDCDDDDFDIDETEDDEEVILEHGKIYDCFYFDEDMNGCSIRLKAVTRKSELVLKELDCNKVHKKTEFYSIRISDDQSPHYHRTWNQIED